MSKQPVVFSPLPNTYGGGIYVWIATSQVFGVLSHRIWLGKENKGVSLAIPLCSDSRKACNNLSIINRFNTHRSPAVYMKDTSDVRCWSWDLTRCKRPSLFQLDTMPNPGSSIHYFGFPCRKSGHGETTNLQKKRRLIGNCECTKQSTSIQGGGRAMITYRFRFRYRHSRPQSPSFLGHVVLKQGAVTN